ncbi:hypothetical protein B2G71_10130 [Novosphingobium sp. PC22D]|uniref:hypothetical protein n=1 Tax=Novosphingobium sp. PC22D TaxID=1962403 RepID=UPI000BEF7A8D|nr:hypothetical protein [Novosphingobium sp. PC22D]PEQ12661.1 hypothetical protein B2G71_10130 [Novosphingobium sp. PC22D]
MAENAPPRVIGPLSAPARPAAPTPRDLRSQAVQRLQVGLFGLCTMLMIVGLANIIMERAKLSAEPDPIQDIVAVDAEPKKPATDPLADIGVVPAADPTPSESASGDAEFDPETEL